MTYSVEKEFPGIYVEKTICIPGLPLFDPECGVVSTDNIATLHQNLTSLASLTTVVTAIKDFAHTNLITLQSKCL